MGAISYYDAMQTVPKHDEVTDKRPERQLEVFTHGGKLYLRVGPIGEENAGSDQYTVSFSAAQAEKFAEAFDQAFQRVREILD